MSLTVYEKAAGLDIHNKFIVGTILSRNEDKIQQRFERTSEGLLEMHEWISNNECPIVACESTNSFWYPIYDCLSPITNVVVGNAYDMKILNHKKSDKIDSEIIAKLALHNMITPSHIATIHQRAFRSAMRDRHFLTEDTTAVKNKIIALFQAELFHLSEILSDPFGKSGRTIINGIMNGLSTAEIMKMIPLDVLKRKSTEIQKLLEQKISPATITLLKSLMDLLHFLTGQIKIITDLAKTMVTTLYPREYNILRTIPGIGDITAMTLLAEIGDFHDFSSGDKLAAWVGLVPKVYQSADHNVRCGITRRGSKHVRWAMVQAAHAATRQKNSRFKEFYEGKKDRLGTVKTIVALARKMLTIAWHLVVNNEEFKEENREPKKISNPRKKTVEPTFTIKEIINTLVKVKKTLGSVDKLIDENEKEDLAPLIHQMEVDLA